MSNIYRICNHICYSAIIGFTIPIIIGIIAVIVVLFKNRFQLFGSVELFMLLCIIPSIIVAIIGGSIKRFDRACIYGSIIFIFLTYLYFNYWYLWIISIELDYAHHKNNMITCMNMIIFTALIGALTGGAGAICRRFVSNTNEELKRPQLSLNELITLGLLLTIILFYIILIV
jgi:hypothetical protein